MCGALLSFVAAAQTLALKENHPQTYVVKKGDTLWDISAHFLKSPWLWPRLWQANPQVKNPHLIYPGDLLTLIWVDGEPRLVRKPTIKLSPTMRVEPKASPIPVLSFDEIGPFLTSNHVFEADVDLDKLPYVLGENENSIAMQEGQTLFVRGALQPGVSYAIYRPGELYKDRVTKEALGREALLSGLGVAQQAYAEDRSVLTVTRSYREIRQGDRLIPVPSQESLNAYFSPQPGTLHNEQAYVVDTPYKVTSVGKFDVVLINRGARDQVQPGDVFSVLRPGAKVVDSGANDVSYREYGSAGDKLFASDSEVLPNDRVGEVMVIKVYDKLSMAFVMNSQNMVRKGYALANP
ncbi:LysM peptidoglycan-binding domain-containing protein [Pseudaeromonas paramecii]|uniref:LysM peptidoglycan-binding domain-containing protein n=1 Tax=Pseudaeromonas paramecii TaxID=2138166 RepID=A0ABP8Q017_9GAMM